MNSVFKNLDIVSEKYISNVNKYYIFFHTPNKSRNVGENKQNSILTSSSIALKACPLLLFYIHLLF